MNYNDVTVKFEDGKEDKLNTIRINQQIREINNLQKIFASQIHLMKVPESFSSSVLKTCLNHYEDYLRLRIKETRPKI